MPRFNIACATWPQRCKRLAIYPVADLRRIVETRLSTSGVGVDVRAQLVSYGLGGLQVRHYDCHDYLSEQRAALETIRRGPMCATQGFVTVYCNYFLCALIPSARAPYSETV